MTERKPYTGNISRRDFLRFSAAAVASKGIGSERGKEILRPTIVADRTDLTMYFSPSYYEDIQKVNEAWRKFYIHEYPTPGVCEGMGTSFGYAANAIGQFKVSTNEILRKLATKRIFRAELEQREERLLDLRYAFDESLNYKNPNYYEYTAWFSHFLNNQGYAGCIAGKSPKDLGRAGFLSLWNPVVESWSEFKHVITLNTANSVTFQHLLQTVKPYEDYVDRNKQKVVLPWVVEVSTEVPAVVNIAPGSLFYRFIEEDLYEKYQFQFPEYEREPYFITPSYANLGRSVSGYLREPNITQLIREIPADPAYAFSYRDAKGADRQTRLDKSSFPAYLLYKGGFDILPNEMADSTYLSTMMKGKSEERATGVPLGNFSFYNFLWNLDKGRIIQKRIVKRDSDDNDVESAFFYLQDCKGGYGREVNILDGVYTDDSYYFFNNQGLQKSDFSRYYHDLRQPNSRIVLYY